jgi:hypothetical protein
LRMTRAQNIPLALPIRTLVPARSGSGRRLGGTVLLGVSGLLSART